MNQFNSHDPIGCPDAELLAAWSEGGLGAGERSRLEEHAATCGRCQAQLAALARMAAADAHRVPREKRLRLWPWLVPAAGAAAAVTVWVMVQQVPRTPERNQQAPQVLAREEADKPMAVPAPIAPAPIAPAPITPAPITPIAPAPANPAARQKVGALAKEERRDRLASPKKSLEGGDAAREAPAAAAPAAPPAALSEALQSRAARAADASAIGGLVVQRSPEGGVTWESQSGGISAQLTAGASPSPSIIWLVGKDGLVLLSTDSRSWKRVPFPESVDLAGIEASSDTTATVTTADARIFATADGGLTWQRK